MHLQELFQEARLAVAIWIACGSSSWGQGRMLGVYIGVNTNELAISREADVSCICPLAFCITLHARFGFKSLFRILMQLWHQDRHVLIVVLCCLLADGSMMFHEKAILSCSEWASSHFNWPEDGRLRWTRDWLHLWLYLWYWEGSEMTDQLLDLVCWRSLPSLAWFTRAQSSIFSCVFVTYMDAVQML